MTRFKCLSILLFIALLTGCDPNDDSGNNNTPDNFSENFGPAVSRDFIGQIVDPDNHPIQNATVKIGAASVQTDINGVFIVNSADVHEKLAYITAKKSGFIDGSRSLVPTSGKNNIKIMLIPAIPLETIASGNTSEVSIYSGTKVIFDGAFEDENGNAYSGDVSVSMFHLTTSDENISSLMPGMLYAEDENGDEKALQTFGMLNVELRGSDGQKLQIANGHTAQITMRIDDSQLATAPSSIPLWHFDAENGYWKQDGSATKQGNYYVGNVSHFSWWNCDLPNSSILLTFNVVDASGNPLANTMIRIFDSGNAHAVGQTDSNGQLAGILPANEELALFVDNNCGQSSFSMTIGPFATDTVLPNIVLSLSSLVPVTVQGNIKNCDGQNVIEGYVLIHYDDQTILGEVDETDGTFSVDIVHCMANPSFTIEGYDYANLETTSESAHNFSAPITNVGILNTCNTAEYITYQLDDMTPVLIVTEFNAGWNGTFSVFGGNIHFYGNINIPGTYTTDQFSIEGGNIGFVSLDMPNTMVFQLNNFGAVGQYIDMTFSGTYVDNNVGLTHNLIGTIHVLRDL
ncbi:MAG TPA: hypothetical protein VK623_00980 [Flavobacterium sp.]|nr:hypothetical protein [Flavobacterium sp.]